jgi:hypothetical protein
MHMPHTKVYCTYCLILVCVIDSLLHLFLFVHVLACFSSLKGKRAFRKSPCHQRLKHPNDFHESWYKCNAFGAHPSVVLIPYNQYLQCIGNARY